MRVFYNSLNQVDRFLVQKLLYYQIAAKLSWKFNSPEFLGGSDTAIKLLSYLILMRTFENWRNEFLSISVCENITSSLFHAVISACKKQLKYAKSRNVTSVVFTLLLMPFWNILIFWCKNVSCTIYETLLLTEKNLRNFSEFLTTLMAITWYSWITLRHSRLREVAGSMKTRLSKIKIYMKVYPHQLLFYMPLPKIQKEFLAAQYSLRILKILRVLVDSALLRFYSVSVPFSFYSDRVLFWFLSNRFIFESSVIGSSSKFSIIDSSLGSSVDIFRHTSIICATACFTLYSTLYFQRKLTINN